MMLGVAYAAVPLYRAFCRATGYGGTPQIVQARETGVGKRVMNVRFDANVAPGLPWTFEPETPEMELRSGTTATVYYRVHNRSDQPTTARAQYNITPDVGGFYFNKINCFCFSDQKLGPGETAELPVVFFLDPSLDRDPEMRNVGTLTLSYTFYAQARSAASTVGASGGPPKL